MCGGDEGILLEKLTMDPSAKRTAETRLLDLCSLINDRTRDLVLVALKQDEHLARLEKATQSDSARLSVAGTRAGIIGYDDLLVKPPARPDLPVPKVQQLEISEMRVRPVLQREHVDHIHLPKPQLVVHIQENEQLMTGPVFSRSHARKLKPLCVAGKS